MTVLDAIKDANDSVPEIVGFSFARIDEFNAFMKSFEYTDYPRNIIVPFQNNGTWQGGFRRGVIPIQGWIIRRIPVDRLEFRVASVEEDYMEPMRSLAKRFIKHLINSDIVDPQVDEITDTIVPEYQLLKQDLFGVSYTLNLPIIGSVC